MKKYSIVRVEQQCPFTYEKQDKRAFLNRCLKSTFQCNDCYGDTKEQLIRKITQVIYKEKIEWYKKKVMVHTISKIFCINAYDSALQVATKIVEFLGVEE